MRWTTIYVLVYICFCFEVGTLAEPYTKVGSMAAAPSAKTKVLMQETEGEVFQMMRLKNSNFVSKSSNDKFIASLVIFSAIYVALGLPLDDL